MSRFDIFTSAVLDGSKALAGDLLKSGVLEAGEDAAEFVRRTEEKLRRWTRQLTEGQISRLEFEFLVRSEKDLAELTTLTRLGIASARLQEFRAKLIDLVVNTAFKVFL